VVLHRHAKYLFLLPVVLYLLVLCVYPFGYNIAVGFEDLGLQNFTSGAVHFIGLENFRGLFQSDAFPLVVHNAPIFTLGSVVPQFLIGGCIALLLRKQTRLARFARALVLFPWLLPFIAVSTVFIWFFDGTNGLVNWILQSVHIINAPVAWLASPSLALWVVILANIWIGIPFNFVLLLGGLQAIPHEMHEAAVVDGATWWSELIHITIPLMRDTILAVLILGIIGTVKVFDLVWIMTTGGPANATQLPATLSYQLSFQNFQFGQGAAMADLMVLVLTVLACIYIWLTHLSNNVW